LALNIRDRAILESAAARLEELIEACRARGPVYCIDPGLTNDVVRKAKGLRTSLGKLLAAVDDPGHQPAKQREKYGDRATWALHELTVIDRDANLAVLRPEARKACRVLLGPPLESEEYVRHAPEER
jgi:hypothetical protein